MLPATSFSGIEGQVLSMVTEGVSSALRLCPLVAILSIPLTSAVREYKMAPGLGHTKWRHTLKYSTLEGWFASLAIPLHLVL